MRKLLPCLMLTVLLFMGCTKEAQTPTKKVTSKENIQKASINVKSNFDLLTSHPWKYQFIYFYYVDSLHLGSLVYERRPGPDYDTGDYGLSGYYFRPDGVYLVKTSAGYVVKGKWRFTNDEQTTYEIITKQSSAPITHSIVSIDSTQYTRITYGGITNYQQLIPAGK